MGNRLSKISTKTGDTGETGLGDGSRISKSSARIHAIGEVDEVNSWVGLLRSELDPSDELVSVLNQIQHDLFDIGGELSVPGFEAVTAELIDDLEAHAERLNESLPPLKEFILPGGNKAASLCHIARTCARRAERTLVELQASSTEQTTEEEINPLALSYINRLSDFFFIAARVLARRDGQQEILWQSRHKR